MQERPSIGAQKRKKTPQQEIEDSKDRLLAINDRLTKNINQSHYELIFAIGGVVVIGLATFIYKRLQVPLITQSDLRPSQLKNMQELASELTTGQLLILTVALFGILVIFKRHFMHREKDHRGSKFMEQISEDEFERQRQTRESIDQQIQGSQAYRQYLRDKARFDRAERALGPVTDDADATLQNLLGDSGDEKNLEAKLIAIDKRIAQVKGYIEDRRNRDDASVSNISTNSVPPARGSTSNFSRTQPLIDERRQSMGPPLSQTQVGARNRPSLDKRPSTKSSTDIRN